MARRAEMTRVCIFCGSSKGARPVYMEAASRVGRSLAERGVGLVYGGAAIGTMGAVADAALAAGGEVIGVIPESLAAPERAHQGLTELRVVDSMHTRKTTMIGLSDALIALPGGHGTLDELFEALTWSQLGIHGLPIGAWNVEGYWTPLVSMMDHMVREGFVRPGDRARLRVEDQLDPLLDHLLLPRPG